MTLAVTQRPLRCRRLHRGHRRQADDPQPRRDSRRVPLGLLGDLPELGSLGSGNEGDGREDGRVRRAQGHARAGPAARCSRPTRRSTRSASSSTASTAIRSCSATSTRATRRSPGDSSASARVFAKFDTATAWFTPELLTIPEATVNGVDRADAGARALPLHHPRQLPAARRTCSTTRASGCSRSPASSTTRRGTIYQELGTSDIKFPTITLADGKEVVLSPGNYAALLETNRNQAERGQGRGGARRHLRRHRQHLRRDLQRRAAARLVPRPGAQLPDHARRRARRQRDPARGGRDADRGDARRRGAVPALRAPAQEAARPAETYHLYDSFAADLPAPTRPIRTSRRASWRWQSVAPLGDGYVAASTSASSPAAGSTSTRTKARAAARTAPACTASARTC